jgi:hypothetical protein
MCKARVLTVFQFPKHAGIHVSCYLAYFSQLLRDLGVENETSISNSCDGDVTLEVRLLSGIEKLPAIPNALKCFLTFLYDSEFDITTSTDADHAVKQLCGVVLHTRGQLTLSALPLCDLNQYEKRQTIEGMESARRAEAQSGLLHTAPGDEIWRVFGARARLRGEDVRMLFRALKRRNGGL